MSKSCTAFVIRIANALQDETDEHKYHRISIFSMDHRRHSKYSKGIRRRIPLLMPASLIFFCLFLFIVSNLLATATLVVRATVGVDGDENGDATIKENEVSRVVYGDQERNILFSSYGVHETEEISIDRMKNYNERDTSSVGTYGDASNKSSDTFSNDNEINKETERTQIQEYIEAEDAILKSAKKEKIEEVVDASSLSFSENITALNVEEVERNNDVEESQGELLVENKTEKIGDAILSSSENEMKDEEVQNDNVMGNTTTVQEVKEEEEEIASITSSPSSENSTNAEFDKVKMQMILGDNINTHETNLEEEIEHHTSSSSVSEKTAKLRPEGIPKKKDMEGSSNSPLTQGDSQSSNRAPGSSMINTKAEEIQKKTMMENKLFEKALQLQDYIQTAEDKEEEEEQTDMSKNNNLSSDSQSNIRKEKNTQDENTSSISKKKRSFPIYDNGNEDDDSYIDLDTDAEGLEIVVTKPKKYEEKGQDDKHNIPSVIIEDENEEYIISGVKENKDEEKEQDDDHNFPSVTIEHENIEDIISEENKKKDEEKLQNDENNFPILTIENQNKEDIIGGANEKKGEEKELDDQHHFPSAIIKNANKEDIIKEANDKARARARARAQKDRRSIETVETTTGEIATAVVADNYRGEPWGQYRSTRRLPDLELLRVVFENSKKTRTNITTGDIKSQKVVNNWRTDPLYDENMTMDTGSREPLLIDKQDQKFVEYRSRFLDENNGDVSTNLNSKSKTDDEKTHEERHDKKIDENNGNNNNNADVNSEFVEGLDDIGNFFEGVDPPDELDVGYGSSIQDVLMDKGKHILLKKVRGVARWIQLGWQTMGRRLEERISQFQLPFQKIEGTTNTVSDFDAGAVDSSKNKVPDGRRDQTLTSVRETLISTWKTGKQMFELLSDFVDGLLDRFDGRSEDDSANFEDFNGFDLDDLSTFPHPS